MNRISRLILALLTVSVLAPSLLAQRSGVSGRPLRIAPGFGRRATFPTRNHPLGSRGFYLGDTPYFYADYPFDSFAAEPAPPTVSVRSTTETPQEPKPAPLLIELRGDKYVRFGGGREVAAPPDYAAESKLMSAPRRVVASPGTVEVPPAVLVYRDGHHEEVSDYAIVGTVMYARGDYWKNGYWTKNIQLSALNIPATLKTNLDHGVKFALPAGPNEVVTRP